jgi:hypothetical protein
MAMSDCEALGGKIKKKAPMAHSSPGSTSHEDEALGGMMKKMAPPAHVGHKSTSKEDEALSQNPKKREFADMSSSNQAAGDALKHIK